MKAKIAKVLIALAVIGSIAMPVMAQEGSTQIVSAKEASINNDTEYLRITSMNVSANDSSIEESNTTLQYKVIPVKIGNESKNLTEITNADLKTEEASTYNFSDYNGTSHDFEVNSSYNKYVVRFHGIKSDGTTKFYLDAETFKVEKLEDSDSSSGIIGGLPSVKDNISDNARAIGIILIIGVVSVLAYGKSGQ